jgi:hypothetical protein
MPLDLSGFASTVVFEEAPMTHSLRRQLMSAIRHSCLAAPLLAGMSLPAHAYTWQAVDLDANALTTEAWYNVDTNTTWMADLTQLGKVTFANAAAAVQNLDYFGTTGWRLPTLGLIPNTTTYASTAGEMGGLVASFGSVAALAPQFMASSTTLNGQRLWYGDAAGASHYFLSVSRTGVSVSNSMTNQTIWTGFAWAVHDGDLRITTSVPEPRESTMLVAGVMALGFMARRRRSRSKSEWV